MDKNLLTNDESHYTQDKKWNSVAVTQAFELLYHATLTHLNDEEYSHIFALPGKKLKATHSITHKIYLTSDVSFFNIFQFFVSTQSNTSHA